MPGSATPAWKDENRRIAALLGARIRAAREAAGISQETLARAARLHRSEIGQLERGVQFASVPTLLACAEVLNVDPGDLIRDLPVPRERRSLTHPAA
jgi:transcriptional regulator with XRE-family HTH domain